MAQMSSYAITVVGHDRPGIIADVTGALAEHGGNLEDSSMTLLRGHFAWTLIVAVDASEQDLDATLESLREPQLKISVILLPDGQAGDAPQTLNFWLTVHGADRPGIVSALTGTIAEAGGNLTNLTTRLAGGLYVIGADAALPADTDIEVLIGKLTDNGAELGVTVSLRPADSDLL